MVALIWRVSPQSWRRDWEDAVFQSLRESRHPHSVRKGLRTVWKKRTLGTALKWSWRGNASGMDAAKHGAAAERPPWTWTFRALRVGLRYQHQGSEVTAARRSVPPPKKPLRAPIKYTPFLGDARVCGGANASERGGGRGWRGVGTAVRRNLSASFYSWLNRFSVCGCVIILGAGNWRETVYKAI